MIFGFGFFQNSLSSRVLLPRYNGIIFVSVASFVDGGFLFGNLLGFCSIKTKASLNNLLFKTYLV